MKHWLTKEEMGDGFQHNEEEHKEFEYNSLIDVAEHEKNTMRTTYIARDIWTPQQRVQLRDLLNELIENDQEELHNAAVIDNQYERNSDES